MPAWSVAFTFGALASLGLPGLSGFPGELATVLESFRVFGWWTLVGTFGLLLSAAYNLRAVRASVHGPGSRFPDLTDLTGREISLAGFFAAGIVAVGVSPGLVLSMARPVLLALGTIAGVGR
jgi:NADH-quinone oxidoreductase subunit M